jgi:carbon starvation protein
VIKYYIGDTGKKLFLIFSFATLVLVIAVFADIVAKTFESVPGSATASTGFILLALLFGLFVFRTNIPLWLGSIIGVGLMYAFIPLGEVLPLELGYNAWMIILFIYIFAASVTPVWALLQPRDYLNSYLLYGMILFGILGVIFANPSIEMSSSVNFEVDSLGYLFPVLFVTIACGALSGFHSLVASGTTSKQVDKETDSVMIGFGGMLLESFLAVLALGSVIILSQDNYMSSLSEVGPVTLFSQGLGSMIGTLGIPEEMAVSFVALTVSAFALTSLDTCTRLARFCVEEYMESYEHRHAQKLSKNRYFSTILPVLFAGLLIVSGEFAQLWPIFGSANQLLGALALLAVSVWLIQKQINPLFTLVPMVFMFLVTLSSLILFAWNNFVDNNFVLGVIATALLVLAVVLILLARKSLQVYFKRELAGEAGVG